jgi:hypothetical protein
MERALDEAGIELPFTTYDLNLRTDTSLADSQS